LLEPFLIATNSGLFCAGVRSQSVRNNSVQSHPSTRIVNACSDVDVWLRSLQLSCYSECFRHAGYSSLDTVRSVTANDLVSIGVVSAHHQQILLNAIRQLSLYYIWTIHLLVNCCICSGADPGA